MGKKQLGQKCVIYSHQICDWVSFDDSHMVDLMYSGVSCYIVTRCTNLVSVHYFLPLAISAKMLINKVASGNWACVNGI